MSLNLNESSKLLALCYTKLSLVKDNTNETEVVMDEDYCLVWLILTIFDNY